MNPSAAISAAKAAATHGFDIAKEGAKLALNPMNVTCLVTLKMSVMRIRSKAAYAGSKILLGTCLSSMTGMWFCGKLVMVVAASVGTGGAAVGPGLAKLCLSAPDVCTETGIKAVKALVPIIRDEVTNNASLRGCIKRLGPLLAKMRGAATAAAGTVAAAARGNDDPGAGAVVVPRGTIRATPGPDRSAPVDPGDLMAIAEGIQSGSGLFGALLKGAKAAGKVAGKMGGKGGIGKMAGSKGVMALGRKKGLLAKSGSWARKASGALKRGGKWASRAVEAIAEGGECVAAFRAALAEVSAGAQDPGVRAILDTCRGSVDGLTFCLGLAVMVAGIAAARKKGEPLPATVIARQLGELCEGHPAVCAGDGVRAVKKLVATVQARLKDPSFAACVGRLSALIQRRRR